MGVVYRAFDTKRGVVVALKAVQQTDSGAILRFKREFRALAELSHPNLFTLYELNVDGENWFFTMELVEGIDFLTFSQSENDRSPRPAVANTVASGLERVRPGKFTKAQPRSAISLLALPRMHSAFRQLAEGVAALHDAGIVHRDLKPSNVLVPEQGRVVILDLGLAPALGPSGMHQSSVPQVLGTASYVPSEQASGLPVTPASDWYSVGSMLSEVLTGRPPFLGRLLEVLMDKQRFEPGAPR